MMEMNFLSTASYIATSSELLYEITKLVDNRLYMHSQKGAMMECYSMQSLGKFVW